MPQYPVGGATTFYKKIALTTYSARWRHHSIPLFCGIVVMRTPNNMAKKSEKRGKKKLKVRYLDFYVNCSNII